MMELILKDLNQLTDQLITCMEELNDHVRRCEECIENNEESDSLLYDINDNLEDMKQHINQHLPHAD